MNSGRPGSLGRGRPSSASGRLPARRVGPERGDVNEAASWEARGVVGAPGIDRDAVPPPSGRVEVVPAAQGWRRPPAESKRLSARRAGLGYGAREGKVSGGAGADVSTPRDARDMAPHLGPDDAKRMQRPRRRRRLGVHTTLVPHPAPPRWSRRPGCGARDGADPGAALDNILASLGTCDSAPPPLEQREASTTATAATLPTPPTMATKITKAMKSTKTTTAPKATTAVLGRLHARRAGPGRGTVDETGRRCQQEGL